jgi:hypothetical protein
MAGAKRRSYKKKGVQRRRKSGYTKRKSSKKRRFIKKYGRKQYKSTMKNAREFRRYMFERKKRVSTGPSLSEMAFVVANHHPQPEAAANAQTLQAAAMALASVSQGDNAMLPMTF